MIFYNNCRLNNNNNNNIIDIFNWSDLFELSSHTVFHNHLSHKNLIIKPATNLQLFYHSFLFTNLFCYFFISLSNNNLVISFGYSTFSINAIL